jgi:hypothetical protein
MAETNNITAPTQFVDSKLEKYAYRRFGNGLGLRLLLSFPKIISERSDDAIRTELAS